MKHYIGAIFAAAIVVAASCGWARADYIGPGDVLELDLSGSTGDADDSGITIWNQSNSATGFVTISGPLSNESGDVEEGFVLLDGTLRVTISDLNPGDYQVLIRREYSPTRVRAMEKREKSIRIMRRRAKREGGGMIWSPAKRTAGPCADSLRMAAPKRQMLAKDRNLLGMQGYYEPDCYAWTVVDQASDFAVGVEIPEPSTMVMLFSVGGFLLGMRVFCRRP